MNTTGNTTPKSNHHTQTTEEQRVPILRGSLKLDASSATPIVTAGNEFSIYVVIRNPFPVPVTIYSTETHIPVELSDEIWQISHLNNILSERKKELAEAKNLGERTGLRLKHMAQDLYLSVSPPVSPRVAIAVSPEVQSNIESPDKPIIVNGNVTAETGDVTFGNIWQLDFKDKTPEEIRQIFWDINEYKQGRQPVVLFPGDSVVQHFILKTTRWLFFTPIAHTFQIQVRYEVDGSAHTDTIPFALNIRAATTSTLIGAVIGSSLGVIVNQQNLTPNINLGQLLLTSGIFALIIVIAFARKNNVQQIVSVEDFWGGMFIGFLVGYSGESFINSVLGTQ